MLDYAVVKLVKGGLAVPKMDQSLFCAAMSAEARLESDRPLMRNALPFCINDPHLQGIVRPARRYCRL